ncbi:MAG: NUDIX hydrolase [Acidimicrobiia bacterium]
MRTPPSPLVGVGALIVERDHLLMVKRGQGANAGLWSVPGGKVAYGESLRDALTREVREETSLEVEVGEPVWTGETIGPGTPPEWHFVLIDFEARVLGGELEAGDDAEAAEWVPLAEVSARRITPSLTEVLERLR